MNTQRIVALLGIPALLLLSACTSFMRSDVVAFYEGPLPQGETIRVEASDPEMGRSLEFRNYARLIGAELTKLGYTTVADPDSAVTLLAEVDYSVEAGPTDVRVERRLPPYVRYHFYYGRFQDPFYFGVDNRWTQEVYSTPSWLRRFTMNIVENNPERTRLFEGRVQSSGRQNLLPQIMPYLITAMFTNFPGESGVTKVVTIEMDE
jgi:hypothetical protein